MAGDQTTALAKLVFGELTGARISRDKQLRSLQALLRLHDGLLGDPPTLKVREKSLAAELSCVGLEKSGKLLRAAGWRAVVLQHENFWTFPAACGGCLSTSQRRTVLKTTSLLAKACDELENKPRDGRAAEKEADRLHRRMIQLNIEDDKERRAKRYPHASQGVVLTDPRQLSSRTAPATSALAPESPQALEARLARLRRFGA